MEAVVEIKARSDQAVSEIEKVKGSLSGLEEKTNTLGQVAENIAPKTEKALQGFEARKLAVAAGGLLGVVTGVKELGMAAMLATGGVTAICSAIGILASVLGNLIQKSKQAKAEWKNFTDQLMADSGALPGVTARFSQLVKDLEKEFEERNIKIKQKDYNLAEEAIQIIEQANIRSVKQANDTARALIGIGLVSHSTMKALGEDMKKVLTGEVDASILYQHYGIIIGKTKDIVELRQKVIDAVKEFSDELQISDKTAVVSADRLIALERKTYMEKAKLRDEEKISIDEFNRYLVKSGLASNREARVALENEYQATKKIEERKRKDIKDTENEKEKLKDQILQQILNAEKQTADEAVKTNRSALLEEKKDTEEFYKLQKQFLEEDYKTKLQYWRDFKEKYKDLLAPEEVQRIENIFKNITDEYKANLKIIETAQNEFNERQFEEQRKRLEQEQRERDKQLKELQEERERRMKDMANELAGFLEPVASEFENLIFGMEVNWKKALKSMSQALIHELVNFAIKKAALAIVNLVTGLLTGGIGAGIAGSPIGMLLGLASVGHGGVATAYTGALSTPYRELSINPVGGGRTTIYNVNISFQTHADRRYVESVILPIFQDLAREGR